MDMQNFDPAVAARVWQRVQACREEKPAAGTEKPGCPLDEIPVVVAQAEETPCRPVAAAPVRRCGNDRLWVVLIWLLLCMR